MQQSQIEMPSELKADLRKPPAEDEPMAFKKSQRAGVLGVDRSDHDVLAGASGVPDELSEQPRADAAAAGTVADVHGAFDGEAISGPGTELAKGCVAEYLALFTGDEDWKSFVDAGPPPRGALGQSCRPVVVDRRRAEHDRVIDLRDLREVGDHGWSYLHRTKVSRT